MKNLYQNFAITASFVMVIVFGFGQTTAMNFSGVDCNDNPVNLFADLDAGKSVVLFYYMPNCGSCPPVAKKIQTMANNINAMHPGKVKAYAFPYQNSTTCAYSSSWVTSNNLPLYTPMDSGAVQVAYYGGFGMPTVVLVGGGNDHKVLFSTQDFNTSDTTTMRNLIMNMGTAGISEPSSVISKLEVFPNPATDFIKVSFNALAGSESFIEMVDLSGKQVLALDKEQLQKGANEKKLNISGIPAGCYIVRVHLAGTIATQKVNVIR